MSTTEGWDSASTRHAVNFLVDEGVLEYVEDRRGVRFALQRIAEHHEAMRLLQRPKALRAAVDDDLGDEGEPGSLTLTLAELAMAETGHELPGLFGRRRPRAVDEAFLFSLRFREPRLVSRETDAHARRVLREPRLAPLVWYAVAANAGIAGHPFGPVWAHATVSGLAPRTRAVRWDLPVRDLLEVEGPRENLGHAFVWIERSVSQGLLPDGHAEELALLLLWFTAPPIERLRAASARVLATMLLRAPSLANRLFDTATETGDVALREGAWTAVLGAVLRSTSDETRSELAGAAARATSGFRVIPVHYRTAELIYRVQQALAGSPVWKPEWVRAAAFRELLRTADQQVPTHPRSLRMPRLRLPRWHVLGDHDVALFDDARDPRLQEYRLRRLVRRLGYFGFVERRDKAEPSLFESDRPYLYAKYADVARQEWLLQGAARYGVMKEHVIRNGVWQKPAPGEGIDASPGDPLGLDVDPSIPLMYAWQRFPDTVEPESWWIPEAVAALADVRRAVALPADRPESSVSVTDPSGATWFVLHGQLRVEVPLPEHSSDWTGPLLQPFSGSTYGGPSLEPAQEVKREVFLVVQAYLLDVDLADAEPETIVIAANQGRDARIHKHNGRGRLLGDELAVIETDPGDTALAAVEATVEHGPYVGGHWHNGSAIVPIPEIRDRLAVRWSGHARDFSAEGELAVSDPAYPVAERFACPLLLAAFAARRLVESGRTLLWCIELSDHPGGRRFGLDTTIEHWQLLGTDGSVRFLGRREKRYRRDS